MEKIYKVVYIKIMNCLKKIIFGNNFDYVLLHLKQLYYGIFSGNPGVWEGF